MTEYPLFIPPMNLAEKKPALWSRQEAKEYYEWLLSQMQPRTDMLIEYFGICIKSSPEEYLLELGKSAADKLLCEPFSYVVTEKRQLSSCGYALSADMGLLVARYLLDESGNSIRWEILQKPKKELSYNLPVLIGFQNNYLEPVGGSVAEANGLLRGKRSGNIWSRMFSHWLSQAL